MMDDLVKRADEVLKDVTPGPWWTNGKYSGSEMGCAIIAARTDCGPLPGNPTRGMVAWASAVLNTKARECEANARFIAAARELVPAMRDRIEADAKRIAEAVKMLDDKDREYNRVTNDMIERHAAQIAELEAELSSGSFYQEKDIDAMQARIAELALDALAAGTQADEAYQARLAAEARVRALEALRPVWAQGWTSDSIAAQVSAAALTQLWAMLGASNQTEAVSKLRAALEGEK